MMSRDMVFVSHANPEDNEFARWISLRLANEGYPVWCDLTKLLGGETFWDDIQDAIKERTIKFLFISSRNSNNKDGTLQELDCAKGIAKRLKSAIRDFIIPLKIDDLAYDDVHITIRRLNQISFHPSWANGLAQLLQKLEQDGVPRNPNFHPSAVGTWWRKQFSADMGIVNEPEKYISNWFPIRNLPRKLFRHIVTRDSNGKIEVNIEQCPYPVVKDSDTTVLSFANAQDLAGKLGPNLYISNSQEHEISAILSGGAPKGQKNHLTQVLRMGWEQMMADKGFPAHEMANKAKCFYFKKDLIPDDMVRFIGMADSSVRRNVVGFRTVSGRKRYWHFGIQGKPMLHPEPVFLIKTHVLFSDDGKTIWSNPDRLHRARRSQCRNWWNDEWRDRLLGTLKHLAGDGEISIRMGSDVLLHISPHPLSFTSPVSYTVLDQPSFPDEDLLRDLDDDDEAADLDEDDELLAAEEDQ